MMLCKACERCRVVGARDVLIPRVSWLFSGFPVLWFMGLLESES